MQHNVVQQQQQQAPSGGQDRGAEPQLPAVMWTCGRARCVAKNPCNEHVCRGCGALYAMEWSQELHPAWICCCTNVRSVLSLDDECPSCASKSDPQRAEQMEEQLNKLMKKKGQECKKAYMSSGNYQRFVEGQDEIEETATNFSKAAKTYVTSRRNQLQVPARHGR